MLNKESIQSVSGLTKITLALSLSLMLHPQSMLSKGLINGVPKQFTG